MSNKKSTVVQNIIETICEKHILGKISSEKNLDDLNQRDILCSQLYEELNVNIKQEEIVKLNSLVEVVNLVQSRLKKNPYGQTLADIYQILEQVAREELHPQIDFNWYARWDSFFKTGNWLTAPEPYDMVEIVLRLEKIFRLKIADQDAESLLTVGQTVQYLWSAGCE